LCRVNSHSESTPVLRELREMVYFTITDNGSLIKGLLETI